MKILLTSRMAELNGVTLITGVLRLAANNKSLHGLKPSVGMTISREKDSDAGLKHPLCQAWIRPAIKTRNRKLETA